MSYGEFAKGVYWGSPYEEEDVAMAVIWALPQLAAACAGGVFVLLVTLVMQPFFRSRARDLGHEKGRASLPPSSEPLGGAEAAHFGTAKNGSQRGRTQARMVLLEFPLARFPWRYELVPLAEGERTVAARLLTGLRQDDLVLMGRGFGS